MTTRYDIANRLREGRQLARKKYQEEEKSKLGNLRAGNSGIMSADGQVAGSCHRVAHLRSLGHEIDPPEDNTLIMFQVGIANEQLVFDDLVHTAGVNEIVKREEEVPIVWHTSNGTRVTGRPDIVIGRNATSVDERSGAVDTTFIPELVLELKSVASVWTTRTVLIDREPKLPHLVQAGHYMWKLGVDTGRLVYKQYGIQSMPDFAHSFFPKQGEKGSEYLEYDNKGRPRSVRPFEIVYELSYSAPKHKGALSYRIEKCSINSAGSKWVPTIVTTEDINRFYEFTSRMAESQDLGPRPITVSPNGEEKSYSNCKYCPLNEVCSKKKLSYSEWLEETAKVLSRNADEV